MSVTLNSTINCNYDNLSPLYYNYALYDYVRSSPSPGIDHNYILGASATVDALIDEETKQLNRALVFSCFSNFEAKQIINISLSFRLPEDKFIWRWEKYGVFFLSDRFIMLFVRTIAGIK